MHGTGTELKLRDVKTGTLQRDLVGHANQSMPWLFADGKLLASA